MWGFSAASEGAAGGMRVRSRAPGLPMSPPGSPWSTSQAFCLHACLSSSAAGKRSGTRASRRAQLLRRSQSAHAGACCLLQPLTQTPYFQSSPRA